MNRLQHCNRWPVVGTTFLYISAALVWPNPSRCDAAILPPSLAWARQVGTSTSDAAQFMSTDAQGGAYITGVTNGSLFGSNQGQDAFVAKYDSLGNLNWSQQFGTTNGDQGTGTCVDGLSSLYVVGQTSGNLGGTAAGGSDAFVRKYNSSSGSVVWTRQLGTSATDSATGVSADALGNVFVSGDTLGNLSGTSAGNYDAFVSKYTSSGSLIWTRQFGISNSDAAAGVAADGLGNVFVAGTSGGGFSGSYVRKYDGLGNLLWVETIPSSGFVSIRGIVADQFGDVYVSGAAQVSIFGSSYAGNGDAFVVKYDPSGNRLWAREIGTSNSDTGNRISIDNIGNVYLTGYTVGNLGGPALGGDDLFAAKFDSTGNLLWTTQLGTTNHDIAYGTAADSLGNLFIAGGTMGSLAAPNAGDYDVFVLKLTEVPECSTLLMALVIAAMWLPNLLTCPNRRKS